MKTAQFKSPKTVECEPLTNKDWAALKDKRDNRKGIAHSDFSKNS